LPTSKDYTLTIYTMSSQRIAQIPMKGGKQKLSYKLEHKGLYYFTITNEKETIQYGKITIY
jgi:hypothetical protein